MVLTQGQRDNFARKAREAAASTARSIEKIKQQISRADPRDLANPQHAASGLFSSLSSFQDRLGKQRAKLGFFEGTATRADAMRKIASIGKEAQRRANVREARQKRFEANKEAFKRNTTILKRLATRQNLSATQKRLATSIIARFESKTGRQGIKADSKMAIAAAAAVAKVKPKIESKPSTKIKTIGGIPVLSQLAPGTEFVLTSKQEQAIKSQLVGSDLSRDPLAIEASRREARRRLKTTKGTIVFVKKSELSVTDQAFVSLFGSLYPKVYSDDGEPRFKARVGGASGLQQLALIGLEAEGLRAVGFTQSIANAANAASAVQKARAAQELIAVARRSSAATKIAAEKSVIQRIKNIIKGTGSVVDDVKFKPDNKVEITFIDKVSRAITRMVSSTGNLFTSKASVVKSVAVKKRSTINVVKQLRADIRNAAKGRPTSGSVEALEARANALKAATPRLKLTPPVQKQVDSILRSIKRLKQRGVAAVRGKVKRVVKPIKGRVKQVGIKTSKAVSYGFNLVDKKARGIIKSLNQNFNTAKLQIKVTKLRTGVKVRSFTREQVNKIKGHAEFIRVQLIISKQTLTKPIIRRFRMLRALFRRVNLQLRLIKIKAVKLVRRAKAAAVVKRKALRKTLRRVIGKRLKEPFGRIKRKVNRQVQLVLQRVSSRKKLIINKILKFVPLEKRVVNAKRLVTQDRSALIKEFNRRAIVKAKEKIARKTRLVTRAKVLRERIALGKSVRLGKVTKTRTAAGQNVWNYRNPLTQKTEVFNSLKKLRSRVRAVNQQIAKRKGLVTREDVLIRQTGVYTSKVTSFENAVKKLEVTKRIKQAKLTFLTGGDITIALRYLKLLTKRPIIARNVKGTFAKLRASKVVQEADTVINEAKRGVNTVLIKKAETVSKKVASVVNRTKSQVQKASKAVDKSKGGIAKAVSIKTHNNLKFALFSLTSRLRVLSGIVKGKVFPSGALKPGLRRFAIVKTKPISEGKLASKLEVVQEGKLASKLKTAQQQRLVTTTVVKAKPGSGILPYVFAGGTALLSRLVGKALIPLSSKGFGGRNNLYFQIRQGIRESRVYRPDLYSVIYGKRANARERANLLRVGRTFGGFEMRRLI